MAIYKQDSSIISSIISEHAIEICKVKMANSAKN